MKPVTKQAARLMHEGALTLADVEHNGIRIDVPYLNDQIKKVGARIKGGEEELRGDKTYREWRKRFGEKAKLGSKEQLATVVFDCLGYKRGRTVQKKTRSEEGDAGTRESKWDEAAFSHITDLPFLKAYFKTEKLKKLKTTYLEGILREVVDGLLHPFYDLHKVITYRGSSSMPNFQNIPIRNKEIGEIIRRCFIPRKGRHLVEMDFSGVEVRIAACYNKDPKLIRYIKDSSTDMHRDMAAKLFMVPIEWLIENRDWAKKTMRDWSKNRWVFPQFYGSVYFQCAPHLWEVVTETRMPDGKTVQQYLREKGIKSLGDCEPNAELRKGTFVAHCKAVEEYMWNETFHVYRDWKKKAYDEYLRDGGFNLYTGFKCEGLFNKNAVLNYRVQGAAFHCLLQTMIWQLEEVRKRKWKSLLVGQIHDCSVGDIHPSELQDYLGMTHDLISRRLVEEWKWINVPMEAEAEVCAIDESWYAKRVWEPSDGVWMLKGA